MTTTQKTVVAVIVLLLIIIGAYYLFAMPGGHGTAADQQQSALGPSGEETTLPSGSDTSDAAMQADLKSVDSQMSGFDSDSASVNQGIDGQAAGNTTP